MYDQLTDIILLLDSVKTRVDELIDDDENGLVLSNVYAEVEDLIDILEELKDGTRN